MTSERLSHQRPERSGTLLALLLRHALHAAPVWVPLALLVQVTSLGWRPARAESERLERERVEVRARYEETRARFESMSAEVEAWSDPVYEARLRELLRARRLEEKSAPERDV